MSAIATLLRFAVSLFLVVDAVTQLANLSRPREGWREIGAKNGLRVPLSILMSIAELLVAWLLLYGPTAPVGALAACLLFGSLIAVKGLNLANGRSPSGGSLGRQANDHRGRRRFVPNLVFLGLSIALLFSLWGQNNESAWNLLRGYNTKDLVTYGLLGGAYVLLLVLAAVVFYLIRLVQYQVSQEKVADAQKEQDGLPVGIAAPAFSLASFDESVVDFPSDSFSNKSALIVFMATHCGPCQSLVADLEKRKSQLHHSPRILLVVAGTLEDFGRFVALHPSDCEYLHQADWKISDEYRINRTPSGVLIDRAGKIAAPTAVGWPEIDQLLHEGATR